MEKNKNILVTGATGLVGAYIIRSLLSSGYNNIYAAKRKKSNLDYVQDFISSVNWTELDILDHLSVFEVVKEMDIVIHAAAAVDFLGDFKELYRVNVEGTDNIVNASLDSDVEKLIYLSSTAALGRKSINNIIDENEEWEYSKYNTDYAISKYHAELHIWRGIAEGLSATVLNPSFILGTGDWERSSLQLLEKVAGGISYYPPGSNGFVDVRDVADAVIKVMIHDHLGQRFIISGDNLDYKYIIETIAKNLNVLAPNKKLPVFLGYLGGYIGNWLRKLNLHWVPLNMDIVRNLLSQNHYNNTKSIEVLGMDYIPIIQSLEEITTIYKSKPRKVLAL
jgi:nucleoside-diphosphate-sugar epimerase